MRLKKYIAAGIFTLGVAFVSFSFSIKHQVKEGREKIQKAEQTVEKSKEIFSLNPITKELGKGLSGIAQKKIEEGSEQADFYEKMSYGLLVGGSLCILLGAGLFINYHRKR